MVFDFSLLEVFDQQLKGPAKYIYDARKKFTEELIPVVSSFYKSISSAMEEVSLGYNSQLHDANFSDLLRSSFQKDKLLQRTNVGIHKDDLTFLLNGNTFKHVASQGQRKSLLFACKLAEFEILKKVKGKPPVLLLDDVFEKLDETRMRNLLEFVCFKNDGQVFITDTHFERLEQALSQFGNNVQIIELQ